MGRAKKAPPSMVGVPGGTDSWCTGQPVVDGVYELYSGQPDFDPCSNHRALIQAATMYYRSGTHLPWKGTGFENPPFSKTQIFTEHGLDEIYHGNCTELVRLVMFAPSTKWWLEMCGLALDDKHGNAMLRRRPNWYSYKGERNRGDVIKRFAQRSPNPEIICTKRLVFGGDRTDTARFDVALVYFGDRPKAFHKAFKHLTRWTARGRL